MKTRIAMLLGVMLVLLAVNTVLAESVMQRFDQRTRTCRNFTMDNVWAGYAIFRNVCKSCHSRDNNVGAPFLYSESKTRPAWDRVFVEMYPGCAQEGVWAPLSSEDLLNLNDYLTVDAANTSNPNEVGYCFG